MSVINEKYDQFRVEKIKNYLEDMATKGQARFFEIYVDSMKVVPKTDDPKQFEDYERYMDEHTEKIRIVVYNSGASPRNDQYCFTVEKNRNDKPLNGLGEIETIVQEKLAARDREYEFARLQEELEKTRAQLKESEEYADSLVKQLELEKTNQGFKKLKLGELASMALEAMVRRNPQWLRKMPVMGEALAGIIEEDNAEMQQKFSVPPIEEPQASFQKKKSAPDTEIKPEYLPYVHLLQQLDETLEPLQLQTVMQILEKFLGEPQHIGTVAELLNNQNGQ